MTCGSVKIFICYKINPFSYLLKNMPSVSLSLLFYFSVTVVFNFCVVNFVFFSLEFLPLLLYLHQLFPL